jgi:hypothetical protein
MFKLHVALLHVQAVAADALQRVQWFVDNQEKITSRDAEVITTRLKPSALIICNVVCRYSTCGVKLVC